MRALLLVLALTQAPPQDPRLGPGPEPVPPPPVNLPPPPCTTPTPCWPVDMIISRAPRWFTPQDFGQQAWSDLDDYISCHGNLLTEGALRYYVNGTAPSALVGQIVPPPPEQMVQQTGPDGTLEYGTIVLWNRALIQGFKAVAASNLEAHLSWNCDIGSTGQ